MSLQFGKIKQPATELDPGMIEDFNGGVLEFDVENSVDDFQKGQLCAFELIPFHTKNGVPHFVQRAYRSQDGRLIVDRRKSHLHEGITPALLKEMCSRIICDKQKTVKVQVDFEEVIGVSNCVEVADNEEVIYAIREGRFGHSKFVLNRQPEPTNSATIVLKKTQHYYKILTAYIGKASEPEPKDQRATHASVLFWKTHALVFGSEPIKKNTIEKDCPWTNRGFR